MKSMRKLFVQFILVVAITGCQKVGAPAPTVNSTSPEPKAATASKEWVPACVSDSKFSSRGIYGEDLEKLCKCASRFMTEIYSADEILMITKMMSLGSAKAFSTYQDLKWIEGFKEKNAFLDETQFQRLYLDNLMNSSNGRVLVGLLNKRALFDDDEVEKTCLSAENSISEYFKEFSQNFIKFEGDIDSAPRQFVFGTKKISEARFELSGKFYYQKGRNDSGFSGMTFGSFSKEEDGNFVVSLNEFETGVSCSMATNINNPNMCRDMNRKSLHRLDEIALQLNWQKNKHTLLGKKLNAEEAGFAAALEIFIPPLHFGKKYGAIAESW